MKVSLKPDLHDFRKGMIGFDFNIKIPNSTNRYKPFFTIAEDDNNNCIVERFIDAVTNKELDDVKRFMSKSLKAMGELNIEELKKVFQTKTKYKYLGNARYANIPQYIRTNSILIMENDITSSIVHVYMVQEPDLYSKWKICGIEKE